MLRESAARRIAAAFKRVEDFANCDECFDLLSGFLIDNEEGELAPALGYRLYVNSRSDRGRSRADEGRVP
jgi:hypothetical protein